MDNLTHELESQGWSSLRLHGFENELRRLKLYAIEKRDQGHFKRAGIGTHSEKLVAIRGDETLWLDEQSMQENVFLRDLARKIQHDLSQYFRCHLGRFEGHFSYYPPGTGYHAHFDQSATTGAGSRDRIFSFILYLNENWQIGDGGELRLLLKPSSFDIRPHLGQLVIFRSDSIFHQVLETAAPRWAISGWFRRE